MGKSRCNLCAKVGGGRMQTLYLRARLLRRRCGMLFGNRKKKKKKRAIGKIPLQGVGEAGKHKR